MCFNLQCNIVAKQVEEKCCPYYQTLGPVHTSHFCRVEFNSIKCDRNATADSYVALVSHLVQNLYDRVCRPAENVLNVEYSIWRTKILSDEGL